MFRTLVAATVIWIASAAGPTQAMEDAGLLSDIEIRKILVERIDVEKRGVGIVVGVIDAKGRRVIGHGALRRGGPAPDGDSLFEIGSITKAFTGLLLSDMVARGEVALDDPAAKLLPDGVTVPERGGRKITLIDLATHTSALPRLPANMAPKDPTNPYADYTVEQLYAFLGRAQLTSEIGSKYEYSNLGVGLLGHVLARRTGMDYEALLAEQILMPLGMISTAITLSPAMKARLASGYDAALKPAPYWDLPTLAGAGALRSSTNDLLKLLDAELGYTDTPLKPAMAAQLMPRRPIEHGSTMALGWMVTPSKTGEIFWHSGGTAGFRTFVGFDLKARTGVVVLTNAGTAIGGDDIGMHLLTGTPLVPPPRQYQAIAVDAELLERYVGRYQHSPQVAFTVTRRGSQLFARLIGQNEYEIFPWAPDAFFWKVVDAQVTFQVGTDKRVTGLVLHQNGQDIPAARVLP